MPLGALGLILDAAASIGGSVLGRDRGSRIRETPIQRQQRQTVDQILQSLRGEGPYSDLFQMDDDAFQRSYVEPARQRFESVTAPTIQQSFIQQGQQRGSGLEGALARAGVDLDTLLNQQFANFQEGALDRRTRALSSVLGMGPGFIEQPGQSRGEAFQQALGGYLSQTSPATELDKILTAARGNRPGQAAAGGGFSRRGFIV